MKEMAVRSIEASPGRGTRMVPVCIFGNTGASSVSFCTGQSRRTAVDCHFPRCGDASPPLETPFGKWPPPNLKRGPAEDIVAFSQTIEIQYVRFGRCSCGSQRNMRRCVATATASLGDASAASAASVRRCS